MFGWTSNELAAFLIQFAGVVMAIVVVLVALYKDDWNARRKKPKLTVEVASGNPILTSKAISGDEASQYELQLVVENKTKVSVRLPVRASAARTAPQQPRPESIIDTVRQASSLLVLKVCRMVETM